MPISLIHTGPLEKCRSYIAGQLRTRKKNPGLPQPGPAIAISYQTGSGAHEIAERAAELLQASDPQSASHWTVFDRQLIERVLVDHNLPTALAKYMPEERRSYIKDTVEELVGLRPPSWVLVPKIAETILHLADAGHVILVGRGANFVTARMPNVVHVRLIGSLPNRIERVRSINHLTPNEAARFVAGKDRGRERYLRTHFHTRQSEDLAYHLIINTDLVPYGKAAQLIADATQICLKAGI